MSSIITEHPKCLVCNSAYVEILIINARGTYIDKVDMAVEEATKEEFFTMGSRFPVTIMTKNPMIRMNIELQIRNVENKHNLLGLCKECMSKIGLDKVFALHDL
jgi:hypothetical protein